MKRIIIPLAVFTSISAILVLLGGFTLPRKPGEVSRCPRTALTASDTIGDRIHPQKVIVRPWKGRHQVYAIFVIPEEYQANNAAVVSIEGESTYCSGTPISVKADEVQKVYAKPGERIVVTYFRTRTASWLIAQGKGDLIKQPHNWSLSVQKQQH